MREAPGAKKGAKKEKISKVGEIETEIKQETRKCLKSKKIKENEGGWGRAKKMLKLWGRKEK